MGDLSNNFNRREFACHCGCGYDNPSPELIAALQELRERIDKPIIVLSGCRCEKHNRAVGGAKQSQHRYGRAADIKVSGRSPREVADIAEKIEYFRYGGIGIYETFTHVDVRGYRVRWNG
ncbi:MAG: D-Ala-D-Ala carboxypeptidase family metallohydrolase [Candidatus Cloacimonadaceae bacterium]